MAYLEKVIDRGNVIEVQKYINGRYGIREKRERAAAQRATPEEQLRWQSKEAVRKVWRLLRDKQNFQPGDLWVTLTYPAKSTPDSDTGYQRLEYGQKPSLRTAIRIADLLNILDLRMLWGGNLTA